MKKTIHYALILDQSGSMHHLRKEVISSFNEQVEKIQKLVRNKTEAELKITFCIFNDEINFRYISEDIERLKKLTKKDYQPSSCTALYDAIGITILKVKELCKDDDPVFLAIFTDGLENASTDYTASDIKHKLKEVEKNNWSVKFYCRYEDADFYHNALELSLNRSKSIQMNKGGLNRLNEDIMSCVKDIIRDYK